MQIKGTTIMENNTRTLIIGKERDLLMRGDLLNFMHSPFTNKLCVKNDKELISIEYAIKITCAI